MGEWLSTHKPAASARNHVLLAALTWTLVGLGLLSAGTFWAFTRGPAIGLPLVVVGVLAGWGKSRMALDRAADRIITRIQSRGDGRCLGGGA